jgi:hypothetical protein
MDSIRQRLVEHPFIQEVNTGVWLDGANLFDLTPLPPSEG